MITQHPWGTRCLQLPPPHSVYEPKVSERFAGFQARFHAAEGGAESDEARGSQNAEGSPPTITFLRAVRPPAPSVR